MAVDDTVPSFPTYAELTQTLGWAGTARGVIATTTPASANVELSQGSRYTEQSVLGVGGMGKVVLARDARIGREVALKVLHAERELAEEERERFLREAQVQGQLEHPSIVPVYDIDRRLDGTTFFTMRRVLGRTLGAILDDLRLGNPEAVARYTQRELLQAFATVCLTIDYAHSRGVVHRDLKPANIMLGDFGEVYVLDWGLARIMEDPAETIPPANRLSVPGTMMGTPLYMAPEQMADPDVGPLADVYSLGAILFEILTLERVRDPRALYAPVEARPSVRTPHRKIAPELETICVKATELDATERYRSARAIQEAIARYLDGDRETEQRRALAATHAERARAALRDAALDSMDYETERGTAIFRHADHIDRLFQSAAMYFMDVPFSKAEIATATRELIARNGLRSCYVRPVVYRGAGPMGLYPLDCPVDVFIAAWQWGAYLGDEGKAKGVRAKVSSWRRLPSSAVIPAAKATG
ncbi:MAG: protein kinase, partial [Myxococcota bacterium]|nr:protein kinase [Myxococcota bacterium]